MSKQVSTIRIDLCSNKKEEEEMKVAIEEPINVYINERYLVTLLATPTLKRELAIGWLFSEGVLNSLDEVKEIVVEGNNVKVETKNPVEEEKFQLIGITRLFTTACGLSIDKFLRVISGEGIPQVKSDYKVKASDIVRMVKELNKLSELYKLTRGTHTSALFEEGRLVAVADDVGRHNTVDKVIGKAILMKSDFSRCVLASSGRQPADMVLKAARVGIPIIASVTSPIYSGILAARKSGVTLICFVNELGMNIYSHPDRILLD